SISWKPTSVWSKSREAFSCEETSQTIVRLPASAARRPSATATVVLPTPPLPVTKTSRFFNRSGAGNDRFQIPARLDDARDTAHICVFGLAFSAAKGGALHP